jgi:CheY-like chemotaxis protein
MYSLTQNLQEGETNRPFGSSNFNIKRLDFRSALVIEQSDVLRHSIVEYLKNRGWIVHGITRAEQALPVLRHIPYHLIVIDREISGMTAREFVGIIQESGKWQATQVVVMTGSQCRSSVKEFTERGAFGVRGSVWREELSKLFANFKHPENDRTTPIPTGQRKICLTGGEVVPRPLGCAGREKPRPWRRTEKHGTWQEKISQLKRRGAVWVNSRTYFYLRMV